MIQLIINFVQALINFKDNPKVATHTLLLILLVGVNYGLSHFTDFTVTIDQITGIPDLYNWIMSIFTTWLTLAIAYFSRILKK